MQPSLHPAKTQATFNPSIIDSSSLNRVYHACNVSRFFNFFLHSAWPAAAPSGNSLTLGQWRFGGVSLWMLEKIFEFREKLRKFLGHLKNNLILYWNLKLSLRNKHFHIIIWKFQVMHNKKTFHDYLKGFDAIVPGNKGVARGNGRNSSWPPHVEKCCSFRRLCI